MSNSPFASKNTNVVNINSDVRNVSIISKNDIDTLGSDIQNNIGRTTNNIVAKMTASNFGDLGDSLVRIQMQADRLDPSKQFSGIVGWFKSKTTNIKAYLKKEFQTAETVFNELQQDLAKRIAANDTWIKDLDSIYEENHNNYKNLNILIQKAEGWKISLQSQIDNFPPIDPADPNALMKSQDKRDLETMMSRLDNKIDTFKRMKMLTENNAPKIRMQQQTSENTITTLRNVIDYTIPILRTEFAVYLHSIENKKDQDLIASTREFSQKALKSSADAAYNTAVEAAKNLNAPAVDNPTLFYLRDKIVATVSEVKRIEQCATVEREKDAIEMQNSTNKFLTQLTGN